MSYAKNFYVDRALQSVNFPTNDTGRIVNLLIPFAAYAAKKTDWIFLLQLNRLFRKTTSLQP